MSDPNVQDWNTTVIRKKNTRKTTSIASSGIPKSGSTSLKETIDENGDTKLKLKCISNETAQFIIQARLNKNLKQTELAKLANLPLSIITDVEKAGSVYKPEILNKIGRVLGVNIPR